MRPTEAARIKRLISISKTPADTVNNLNGIGVKAETKIAEESYLL